MRIDGWDEAQRLGHDWVGTEHLLIALSRLDGTVGETLRAAGASAERLVAELERGLATGDPPMEPKQVGSPAFTPAHYRTLGLAEGLALAAGEETAPEHLLLAVLWRANGLPAGILHHLGIDRVALMRELEARGARVPPGEPQPLDLSPKKRIDVPYEQLMMIVRELPRRLPADAHFGFNVHHETRRAWIVVDEGVEAEPLVDEILARPPTA